MTIFGRFYLISWNFFTLAKIWPMLSLGTVYGNRLAILKRFEGSESKNMLVPKADSDSLFVTLPLPPAVGIAL